MAEEPNEYLARSNVAVAFDKMGQLFWASGDNVKPLEHYRRALAIRQKLSADYPNNVEARVNLALARAKIGEAFAALASQEKIPARKRIERWREARAWFQRSLDVFLEMQTRGALSPANAGEMERVKKELSRCDVEISH